MLVVMERERVCNELTKAILVDYRTLTVLQAARAFELFNKLSAL